MSSNISVVSKPTDRAWWREATVYQIYPASFADHDANGHGTLRGILSKIPYLHSLGVDVVWLSPIYESPQADMGYDISDYQAIDPRYGTMSDWEDIRDACHERGMKLVMDLVVNHSSDQHAWFKESRSSRDNPKRDWYIWRDPKINDKGERGPPNNWKGCFGAESAWDFDEGTQQYYLHLFLKEQPDLNWEKEDLRHAVYDMMHWWLKKGCDGFRMDVINFIAKDEGLPDAPIVDVDRDFQDYTPVSVNRPKVHDRLKEMNKMVLSHYDCFAVGEAPGGGPVSQYTAYSVPSNKELQMMFHFHHQNFDRVGGSLGSRTFEPNWKLSITKKIFNAWQVEMERAGGWNSNYLENHDQPRVVTRFTSDHPEDRVKGSKLMSMFHCALTGTLFIYQGQEIGMCNVPRDWEEKEYIDIETIMNMEGERAHRRKTTGVKDPSMNDMLSSYRVTARDNGRTPMQWDTSANAGFSKAKPWMRIHDDYADWNVAVQVDDPNSPWSFWQKMIKLRKQYPALVYGRFIPIDEENEETAAWIRDDPTIGQRLLVVLNLVRGNGRGKAVTFEIGTLDVSNAKLIVTNGPAEDGSLIKATSVWNPGRAVSTLSKRK